MTRQRGETPHADTPNGDDDVDPFVNAIVGDLLQALERLEGEAVDCLSTEPSFVDRVRDRLDDLARELGHGDYRHALPEQRLRLGVQAVAHVYFETPVR
jgi:hypothetical protein